MSRSPCYPWWIRQSAKPSPPLSRAHTLPAAHTHRPLRAHRGAAEACSLFDAARRAGLMHGDLVGHPGSWAEPGLASLGVGEGPALAAPCIVARARPGPSTERRRLSGGQRPATMSSVRFVALPGLHRATRPGDYAAAGSRLGVLGDLARELEAASRRLREIGQGPQHAARMAARQIRVLVAVRRTLAVLSNVDKVRRAHAHDPVGPAHRRTVRRRVRIGL